MLQRQKGVYHFLIIFPFKNRKLIQLLYIIYGSFRRNTWNNLKYYVYHLAFLSTEKCHVLCTAIYAIHLTRQREGNIRV